MSPYTYPNWHDFSRVILPCPQKRAGFLIWTLLANDVTCFELTTVWPFLPSGKRYYSWRKWKFTNVVNNIHQHIALRKKIMGIQSNFLTARCNNILAYNRVCSRYLLLVCTISREILSRQMCIHHNVFSKTKKSIDSKQPQTRFIHTQNTWYLWVPVILRWIWKGIHFAC